MQYSGSAAVSQNSSFDSAKLSVKNISDINEFELDVSSIYYAHSFTKNFSQQFCVIANLNEAVNKQVLIKAVSQMFKRFPTFFVVLQCKSFKTNLIKKVFPPEKYVFDDCDMCVPFDVSNTNEPLIRIISGDKKIKLDVFHGITDGTGATIFLKTLLTAYFNLLDADIPYESGALDIKELANPFEIEDSFMRVYNKKGKRAGRSGKNAFQMPVNKANGKVNAYIQHFSAARVKAYSKTLGVSFTEFLVAAYAYSFYLVYGKTDKPVSIQVPINLRSYFGSETLRNFTLYCTAGLSEKDTDVSFEHMLEVTHRQFAEGKQKSGLQEQINANVHDAMLARLPFAARGLVKVIINTAGKLCGENLCTSTLSSVGMVKLSDKFEDRVESIDMVIGKSHINTLFASAISYKDVLSLSVSSVDSDTKVPAAFFKFVEEKINPAE